MANSVDPDQMPQNAGSTQFAQVLSVRIRGHYGTSQIGIKEPRGTDIRLRSDSAHAQFVFTSANFQVSPNRIAHV